jgi:hypothetical protein
MKSEPNRRGAKPRGPNLIVYCENPFRSIEGYSPSVNGPTSTYIAVMLCLPHCARRILFETINHQKFANSVLSPQERAARY